MRCLTEYQRGSIFGAILIGVAFAAALSVTTIETTQPQHAPASEGTKDVSADHHEDETFWGWATADPVAAFTLGLMIVAGLQAIMFFFQLRYMREGIGDAAEASRAARDTAEAATKSNQINRDFAIADQRPWVSLEIIPCDNLLIMPNFDVVLDVTVEFQNFGKSPASCVLADVTIVNDAAPGRRPIPISPTQDKIVDWTRQMRGRDNSGGITVFPSKSQKAEKITVKGNSFSTVMRGDQEITDPVITMYVVAAATYTFADGREGQTRFCGRLVKKSPSHTMIVGLGYAILRSDNIIRPDDLILAKTNIGNSAT